MSARLRAAARFALGLWIVTGNVVVIPLALYLRGADLLRFLGVSA